MEQANAKSVIPVVDITDSVARRVLSARKHDSFAETLASATPPGYLVGAGDVLEVSVWEAPPAALFGAVTLDSRSGVSSTRSTTFPEQLVNRDGEINVPFAGAVRVAGKTPQQIETEIARRLAGKANQPQVLVRVIRNATSTVTVVGEVNGSTRMPLTAKGERLLDAIAAAGGVRQSVGRITVQLSRDARTHSMPMESIIEDPSQNVYLLPGDVVTVLYQPLSFTVLGATGKNEEINFEAQGISLAQALARSGGLQDARADARGVFIFRFEDPKAMPENERSGPATPDGNVPVVYRLDLKDPASFLVAQDFPVRNHDVLYVANAPAAELQKFLNILSNTVYTVSGLPTIK
jgi:polysaccharide export outer membrane protein